MSYTHSEKKKQKYICIKIGKRKTILLKINLTEISSQAILLTKKIILKLCINN